MYDELLLTHEELITADCPKRRPIKHLDAFVDTVCFDKESSQYFFTLGSENKLIADKLANRKFNLSLYSQLARIELGLKL